MAPKLKRLPDSGADQAFVQVSAIETGMITLPEEVLITPTNPWDKRTVPSLAFLIEHPGSNVFNRGGNGAASILFDLGLRKDIDLYLPPQQAHLDNRMPYRLGPSVASILEDYEMDPGDIDAVILSHVHYDHHGDPEDFDQSLFLVGPGSRSVLKYGAKGSGPHQCFDAGLLPPERTIELPPIGARNEDPDGTEFPDKTRRIWHWRPIGPFPNAIDIFGDQSLYIIHAPGHLPGHINLLCRTGPNKWVYLAADSFHDHRLLDGEKGIGTWKDGAGHDQCIHVDIETSRESINRIRRLRDLAGETNQQVEIILAHDDVWLKDNRHRMFPTKL